jgi:regulator of nucleoside diphosphate kinase
MDTRIEERRLTALDHVRLFNLVSTSRAGLPEATAKRALDLLDLAEVVDVHDIASDIVTMRSRVRLSRADAQDLVVTLSYPTEAVDDAAQLSVFTPLGLSLLGTEVGDTVEWTGPDGEAHAATVAEILYQPEAAGDFLR